MKATEADREIYDFFNRVMGDKYGRARVTVGSAREVIGGEFVHVIYLEDARPILCIAAVRTRRAEDGNVTIIEKITYDTPRPVCALPMLIAGAVMAVHEEKPVALASRKELPIHGNN